jgi:pimeloyl-ACP methyl ester carboxylesterase
MLSLAVAAASEVEPRVLAGRIRELRRLDCTEALRRCAAPILYLQAEHDRLVRRGSLRLIQRIRPDVRERMLPAPHLLLQTAPKEAWHAIRAFLGEERVN